MTTTETRSSREEVRRGRGRGTTGTGEKRVLQDVDGRTMSEEGEDEVSRSDTFEVEDLISHLRTPFPLIGRQSGYPLM